jgi:hypothetical protein
MSPRWIPARLAASSAITGRKTLTPVAPVVLDGARISILSDDGYGLVPELAQHFRIIPNEARPDFSIRSGTQLELEAVCQHVRVSLSPIPVDPPDEAIDDLGVRDIDQKLCIRWVLLLRRVGQQKAQPALADQGGDVGHAGTPEKVFSICSTRLTVSSMCVPCGNQTSIMNCGPRVASS